MKNLRSTKNANGDKTTLMFTSHSTDNFLTLSPSFTSDDHSNPALFPHQAGRTQTHRRFSAVNTSSHPDWLNYMTSLVQNVFATVSCKNCSTGVVTTSISTGRSSTDLDMTSPLNVHRELSSKSNTITTSKSSLFSVSRKSNKKTTATTPTSIANQSAANLPGGGNATGTFTPLGSSPTSNFFSSFVSSNFANQQQTSLNAAANEADGASANHQSSAANFHISSLPPFSLVGAFRGSTNGSESSPNESADEWVGGAGAGGVTGSGGGAVLGSSGGPPYLARCMSQERVRRYQECKSMVQLPTVAFDRLEWLAYHATFLVRFVGMFWLSNDLSAACSCSTLSAPHNFTWTMLDEKNGKKTTNKSTDAKTAIESSLKNLEKILDNEDLFPSKYGNQFNNDFEVLVKRCIRSLYFICSHLIHAHFQVAVNKHVDNSLIDLFSYLLTFARQFSLIDKKELIATEDIEACLCHRS